VDYRRYKSNYRNRGAYCYHKKWGAQQHSSHCNKETVGKACMDNNVDDGWRPASACPYLLAANHHLVYQWKKV